MGNWLKNFRNYDLKRMKATLSLCFNIQSTVEAYCGVDVYIHVFLTTALDRDVPLNAMSDTYLSGTKNNDHTDYGAWCESENGGIGQRKVFRHI